uniref:Uncharacterized protein n=1 Tax=Sphaerodactylus townsendi TaxID=933632 RepID=A0ACB8G497_9SAUR
MTNNLAWLLVLLLRSVLNKTVGQPPPPGFRYASYEVIIPRKQTPRSGHKEPHSVNYLLKLEGKNHLVYLRQKRAFVSKHFPVFTYSVEGDLQVDYPFIRDDCFYNGFVQGRAKSAATFSTCSGGLRGALQVENKSYEIEPVQASATFQHVVYRLEEEKGAIRMRCGLTQEEKLRQTAMIQNSGNVTTERSQKRPWWTHKTYAKIVIVVEHERYIQFGRNETVVALNVLNVIHLTNSWYDPLGIQVSLVLLESAAPDASIFQLELFAGEVLVPVIYQSIAMGLQHGVLKMFMYKMEPHAKMVPTVIMGIAQLTVNNAK